MGTMLIYVSREIASKIGPTAYLIFPVKIGLICNFKESGIYSAVRPLLILWFITYS